MDAHFTPKAHWVIAASTCALLLSLWAGSWVLLFVAFAGLLMVGSSRFGTGGRLPAATRRIAVDAVDEGEELPVSLRLHGPRRRSCLVELRDKLEPSLRLGRGQNHRIVFLRARSQQSVDYNAIASRLGTFTLGPLEARREDPFALRTRTDTLAATTSYLVRPRKETLRQSPERSALARIILGRHSVSQSGDGFDFFGLRDYVQGDRMRSVNWKASARSPRLVVNQFERESHAEITVFVDARGAAEAGLESDTPYAQGGRAVASLLQRFLRARDRVRIIAYGDGVQELGEPGRALRMEAGLDALAKLTPRGDNPLLMAVEQELSRIPGRSPVFIVSSLIGDPTVEEAVTALSGRGLHVTVLVPVPVPPEPTPPAWSLRLLEQRIAAESMRSLGALVLELHADKPLSPQIRKAA